MKFATIEDLIEAINQKTVPIEELDISINEINESKKDEPITATVTFPFSVVESVVSDSNVLIVDGIKNITSTLIEFRINDSKITAPCKDYDGNKIVSLYTHEYGMQDFILSEDHTLKSTVKLPEK